MKQLSLISVALVLSLVGFGAAIAQTNPSCPKGWSYFAKSNKCFQVFGASGTDGVTKSIWSIAEEYCNRFNKGHLASFDSEEEITFVVKLAHATGYDDRSESQMHIGLGFSSVSGWSRPDGESLIYVRWYCGCDESIASGVDPAGTLITRRVHTGHLSYQAVGVALPFVCQMAPVTEG